MKQQNEIKLNTHGQVDVEYYVAQAHVMRAEYTSKMWKEFKSWVASHMHLSELKGSFSKLVHH